LCHPFTEIDLINSQVLGRLQDIIIMQTAISTACSLYSSEYLRGFVVFLGYLLFIASENSRLLIISSVRNLVSTPHINAVERHIINKSERNFDYLSPMRQTLKHYTVALNT
jgi:hypothetical protein